MRAGLLVLLVAGCASAPRPPQLPVAAAKPAAPPTAAQILAAMEDTYAHAWSYRDRADTVWSIGGRVAGETTATAFVRPDALRIEIRGEGSADAGSVLLVASGSDVQVRSPSENLTTPDLALALGRVANHAFAAADVPGLLLPARVPDRRGTTLAHSRVDGETHVDGHACWLVTGARDESTTTTLAIDEVTHALRRVHVSVAGPQQLPAVFITHYVPELDAPLAAQVLAGDAPTLLPAPAPRAWLGVQYKPSYEIQRVVANTPAARAGLHAHDTVVSLDGRPLAPYELAPLLRLHAPGDQITLGVRKRGETVIVPVVLQLDAYHATPPKPAVVATALTGAAAPDFDVVPLGDAKARHALAQFRGQVLVLDFWATWCGPCRMTMPGLGKLQAAHADGKVTVLGVSAEDADDVKQFLAKNPLGYAIANDETGDASAAYGAQALPSLFVIDKKGVVRNVFLGAGHDQEIAALVDVLALE